MDRTVGVILAAGIGSRLGEIGQVKPKTLLHVAGKTILESQLAAFEKAGIERVVVGVGHFREQVEDWIGQYNSRIKVTAVRVPDFARSNNFVTLAKCLGTLPQNVSVLAINGDVLIEDSHFLPLLEFEEDHDAVFLVDERSWYEDAMKVRVNSVGDVMTLSKELARSESNYISCDSYLLRPAAASRLMEIYEDSLLPTKESWVETVFNFAISDKKLKVRTVQVQSLWSEIDTPSDLSQASVLHSAPQMAGLEFDTAFFDLDGTLVRRWKPIPDSINVVNSFIDSGIRVIVVSNNTSVSPDELRKKLISLGFRDKLMVRSPLMEVLEWVKSEGIDNLYPMLNESPRQWLQSNGVRLTDSSPDAIILGYWTELDYETLASACELIRAGVPYFVTHSDLTYPGLQGPIPDAGAFELMLSTVTGTPPVKVFGKPEVSVLGIEDGSTHSQAIFVGDKIGTDMRLGRKIGSKTILFSEKPLDFAPSVDFETEVDFVIPRLSCLLRLENN